MLLRTYLVQIYSLSTQLDKVKDWEIIAVEAGYPTSTWVECVRTVGVFDVFPCF